MNIRVFDLQASCKRRELGADSVLAPVVLVDDRDLLLSDQPGRLGTVVTEEFGPVTDRLETIGTPLTDVVKETLTRVLDRGVCPRVELEHLVFPVIEGLSRLVITRECCPLILNLDRNVPNAISLLFSLVDDLCAMKEIAEFLEITGERPRLTGIECGRMVVPVEGHGDCVLLCHLCSKMLVLGFVDVDDFEKSLSVRFAGKDIIKRNGFRGWL